MTDTTDLTNPAVAKHTAMPPALIEAIQEDPALIQPIARAMGAINLNNLFVKVTHPDASITQQMEFQRLVNKLGRLEPEATVAAPGAGFSITINIPDTATSKATTIEATATHCEDAEEVGA